MKSLRQKLSMKENKNAAELLEIPEEYFPVNLAVPGCEFIAGGETEDMFFLPVVKTVSPVSTSEVQEQGSETKSVLRVLSFIEGFTYGAVIDDVLDSPYVLRRTGQAIAHLDTLLLDFIHPALNRTLKWDFKVVICFF